jgi:hypothetical protein
LVLSEQDPTVRNFVGKVNSWLMEQKPEARLEGLRITIHGGTVETETRLIPVSVVASAEDWERVSKSVELEVTRFANRLLEDHRRRG